MDWSELQQEMHKSRSTYATRTFTSYTTQSTLGLRASFLHVGGNHGALGVDDGSHVVSQQAVGFEVKRYVGDPIQGQASIDPQHFDLLPARIGSFPSPVGGMAVESSSDSAASPIG
ncbi:hypothetical protein C1H46_026876 [Malus baccata]|uniref:Uncharacterized protein n=1 Tax=Malus baccata TaxID=106549 RepID=A0A540LM61_MALBA|nr:hypothetical protein C1H46_026876 [Malus baccata]